ncbi:MAG: transposase [Deltaproteobacteria bacterium]|nr:transposase [Deltaproteobacteria bacterium]
MALATPAPSSSLRLRRPQDSLLWRVVNDHLADFRRLVQESYEKPLPRYVENEFDEYLRCGDYRQGYTRVFCKTCGHLLLVPFSCLRRGICPSCAGRRMSGVAVHLVDRVLPDVPLRQWVVTFPWELRRLAAFRADVIRAFTRRFSDAVFAHFKRRFRGVGRGGAVVFQQRAGGSINLHVHLHGLFLDGVFRRGPGDVLVFRRATPPTREELADVLYDVRERCMRWLRREGLVDPEDPGAIGDSAECGPLEGLGQAAMQRGTVESLPLPGGARPDDPADLAFAPQPGGRWSVSADGWNLHAGVCIPAGDFEGRERLVRYAARPSLALGRLSELPDGRLAYRVRWARSEAGPYRIMEPLDFLARLAAIVPPPRYPLQTYHGVLAPASRWRPNVVPRARDAPTGCAHGSDAAASGNGARATAPPGGTFLRRGEAEPAAKPVPPPAVPRAAVRAVGLLARSAEPDESEYDPVIPLERWKQLADGALLARAPRIDWPRLLRRTFAQDVLVCPKCNARLQVLDVVAKPDEARRELAELGFDIAGSGVIERSPAEPTGRKPQPACDAVRRDPPGRTRSPPARAGPDAPGACIRSP